MDAAGAVTGIRIIAIPSDDVAFATIALAARREYQRRGSLSGTFGGLYLEATLARVDRWYASAVASVAAAEAEGVPTARVLEQLRREGASDDELALLERTAHEVGRLDATFRPYLPSVLTERIRGRRPDAPPPAGEERVITIMFADLAGFTPFSETRPPAEVVEMLNTYWAAVVPAIEDAGGAIEHFARAAKISDDVGKRVVHAGPELEDIW